MGIPHLYTHLRPYARPESFPPPDGQTIPLYIDGPGLAYHVYQLALNSTHPTVLNPWESALPYAQFQDAVIKYLDLLKSASFSICKIYFDGHLPSGKYPTRFSRLGDSLRRLKSYHSQHPRALRNSSQKRYRGALDVFSETSIYTPRTSPLPTPPFIVAAMIEILSAHPIYGAAVFTVPGEAESYCARDAISTGGIVLTGDSDLLLFTSQSGIEWGVIMFKDINITFPGPSISAAVFRPTAMAKSLGLDLTFLGFLTQSNSHDSFTCLKQRAARISEREKSGAVVGEHGKRWREFAAVYALPPPCDPDTTVKGVEPRIAEIIQQWRDGDNRDTRTMFLPFLWEDPTRGSAWDTGRNIRAVGYSLLFPASDYVKEVCRRGQRISDGLVQNTKTPCAFLRDLVQIEDEKWWVRLILEEIILVFENRGQSLPEEDILQGVAHMLSRTDSPRVTTSATKHRVGWGWERIQIFAMTQAAWYSLLLLKELLSTTEVIGGKEGFTNRFETLPGVAECIDGRRFLEGIALSGEAEKRLVGAVVEAYYARLSAAREGEDEAVDDIGSSPGNGNGKRPGSPRSWEEVETGKRKRMEKEQVRCGESEEQEFVDTENTFTVLESRTW